MGKAKKRIYLEVFGDCLSVAKLKQIDQLIESVIYNELRSNKKV